LSWYFISFFRCAWDGAHLTKKWGTVNTLTPGQSKEGKA